MNSEKRSIAYEKAYAFSIRIVKCCHYLTRKKKEYTFSKQLLRCGTSIGANLAEANGAISKADFSAKVSIAYKECQESKYWLSLLKDTNYLDEPAFKVFTKIPTSWEKFFSQSSTQPESNQRMAIHTYW